jgi:hypothetical protein
MNENCGQDMLRSDAGKGLRLIVCLESTEDSINSQPEGKTKFLFPIVHCLLALWDLKKNSESREIPQTNGSETTSTGIGPGASGESASNFVPGLLNPRLT